MASINGEEFAICYEKNAQVRGGSYRKHVKPVQRDCFITKTLCDPANALSNKCKARILNDQSDGFCANVPYSMNKQRRWKNITPESLLEDHANDFLEAIVIDRTDVPFNDSSNKEAITRVNVIVGNSMEALSSRGRRKPLTYFNKQIRYLTHVDKEEAEPAKIHYNIAMPAPTLPFSHKKWKKKKRHCSIPVDPDDVYCAHYSLHRKKEENNIFEEDLGSLSDNCSRGFTLADYLVLPKSAPQQPRASLETSDNYRAKEKISTTAPLLDISKITKGDCTIFEVIEVSTTPAESPLIDYDQILSTVPKRFIARQFGPRRIFVRGPACSKTKFAIFFEEDESRKILRARVSINTQYIWEGLKDKLHDTVKKRAKEGFASLFNALMNLITRIEIKNYKQPEKDSRMVMYRKNYLSDVISKTIAPLAVVSADQELIEYLDQYYFENASECSLSGQLTGAKICFSCQISMNTDIFLTKSGSMCRECLASLIMRQLRMNNLPVDIPIVVPGNTSALELLYAVLPIPAMSYLIEKSFAYFKRLEYPDLQFMNCPHCAASLMTLQKCKFNSFSCPCCGYAFCLFCEAEPHWPMHCEQFKKWSKRWDVQCIFEENSLDNEHHVRYCINCNRAYRTTGSSLRHPGCYFNSYCWNGEFGHSRCFVDFVDPKILRLIETLGVYLEYCDECGTYKWPNTIELTSLVNKDFSTLCWQARSERFNQSEVFTKQLIKMVPSKKERCEMEDLRKTVLFLVENCAGWVYVTKPDEYRHLLQKISRLLQQLFSAELPLTTTSESFFYQMTQLKLATQEFVRSFNQSNKS